MIDITPEEEAEVVDIQELIDNFLGYDNPFWYEKQKPRIEDQELAELTAQEKLEWEKRRPNTPSSGTQPDIEIRWKNYPKCAGTNHMIEFMKSHDSLSRRTNNT